MKSVILFFGGRKNTAEAAEYRCVCFYQKYLAEEKYLNILLKGALNIILMIVNIGVQLLMVMVIYKIKLN